jgi:predicted ATPase
VAKLQQALAAHRFPQTDTFPLLASLLSLPHPDGASPIILSPQKQKQKTQEALVAWIVEEAEKAVVYCAWEDLHWIDPSSLEVLGLLLDQVPTTRLLTLLTFRPDFTPPWRPRAHFTQLTLNRLGRPQVEAMVTEVTRSKTLPAEVLQQIVMKTDGVPLFVEELTKMVLESGFDVGARLRPGFSTGHVPLPLAIPATLHDSLMARLDRLGLAKEVAQVGATLGREFSYELIHAISSVDEGALQHGLRQLVEAELVYQRGLPPQATYLFKHALLQDTAYQSLLKSTRQQYHQQIAQVLEERFAETKETQPEMLAHHYTEAGLVTQAIFYWQKAGQRAIQRSASAEAISHLTKGLDLLKTLPDTLQRAQQELTLQIALGGPLMAAKGYTASEVETTYTRARELCQQVGETPQLFFVLRGLEALYLVRGQLQRAHKLGEQLLTLAQRQHDPMLLIGAHMTLGGVFFFLGEFAPARRHLEQGMAFYDPEQYRSLAWPGAHPAVQCLFYEALALWLLGYPDQALKRSHEALALAQDLSHPLSLAAALNFAAHLQQFRREWQAAQERAETLIVLSNDQEFPSTVAVGTIVRGQALAEEEGRGEEGIAQIRQGLAALQAKGAEAGRPLYLTMLAEAYEKVGQAEEGLNALSEALTLVNKTEERYYEAELYRLKGKLTLQKFQVSGSKFQVQESPKSGVRSLESEAEECFLRAIEIARRQEAKSLELRAVMSLSRLWQQQGKRAEARQMLADIYGWFTEGFDTKDLQEAKALLDELT